MRTRTRQHRPRQLCLSATLLICLVFTIYIVKNDIDGKHKEIHPMHLDYGGQSLLQFQRTMLKPYQHLLLDQILSGQLSKIDVEIVLSRHNEDISWSDMYSSIRTVYDKSDNVSQLPANTAGKV